LSRLSSNDGGAPEPVVRVAELMAAFGAPWALCGGWAVDAWLGRTTREHGDIDFSVFAQDHAALHAYLSPEWQMVAHAQDWDPANGNEVWDGRRLEPPAHLHARSGHPPLPEDPILRTEQGFELDIQVDECQGDEWVLCREPRIALPVAEAVRPSPWGVPAAAPEVLLFFKSRELRRRDKADFAALAPMLDRERRAWLRAALERAGHPWVRELSAAV